MSINRGQPEKIFAICKNGDTAALAHGDLVAWDSVAADGVTVKGSPASAGILYVAGVVHDPSGNGVGVGEYALVQVYGYHSHVKAVAGVTAMTAIKSGATAKSVALGATADDPVAQIGISLTAVSGGYCTVLLRVM